MVGVLCSCCSNSSGLRSDVCLRCVQVFRSVYDFCAMILCGVMCSEMAYVCS